MGPLPSGLHVEKTGRAPFAPIESQICNVAFSNSNAPSPVRITPLEPASAFELSLPSSPVAPAPTVYQNRAMLSMRGLDPASHQTEKIKVRSNELDRKIRVLRKLAETFRGTVKDVTNDFDTLRENVGELTNSLEALEADHIAALACLEEEKDTVNYYFGLLRNAEKELFLIYQKLEGHPDELDIIPGGFSQATSTEPIFERFV